MTRTAMTSESWLETTLAPERLAAAWDRVRANGGAPGQDGQTVRDFAAAQEAHLFLLRAEVLAGEWHPRPVRVVEIPKPGGGLRRLGIPTVADRVIHQALAQALSPLWEPNFSASSFAYRPGRGAHDAVHHLCRAMRDGCGWAADLDIEKFFDSVDQSLLLQRLRRHGLEKSAVALIERILRAGAEQDGVLQPTPLGIPQGSPLSPLLANIVLDDFDQWCTRQAWAFARYADDVVVLAPDQAAAEAIRDRTSAFLESTLQLRLNAAKSRVVPATSALFLGFGFERQRAGGVTPAISAASRQGFATEVARLGATGTGQDLDPALSRLGDYVRGWTQYFSIAQPAADLAACRELALLQARALVWRHWATPARRETELLRAGLSSPDSHSLAHGGAGADELAASPALRRTLPAAWFAPWGLATPAPDAVPPYARFHSTMKKPRSNPIADLSQSAGPLRRLGWLLPLLQFALSCFQFRIDFRLPRRWDRR